MKAGGDGELNSEINVTPLVDVMLVLLIIFMITAPLMQNNGVSVELPQVTAEEIEDESGPLVLEIQKNDTIKLGKTVVTWVKLKELLEKNEKVKADGKLYIAADKELLYGRVATAMAIARSAKRDNVPVVKQVMFLTSPSDLLDLKQLDKNSGH
jgi:biopolymer transport protein ExbD